MSRTSSSSSDFQRAESLRRSRSLLHPFSAASDSASRSSYVPSAVVPYFRRPETPDAMSTQSKGPLLTLTLSSTSFLDSTIQDQTSSFPLYKIQTEGNITEVSRSDDWGTTYKAASIKWSKHARKSKGKGRAVDETQLQMRGGRWKDVDAFISPATMTSSPRKFNIPGYSHGLKWRAMGSSYWCVAASAKGPIATFEPAGGSTPPKLVIYETLHDKYEYRPMSIHRGVSLLLLDYLIVSVLFLVTDAQEWMTVRKFGVSEASSSAGRSTLDSSPKSAGASSASAKQWRKFLYGEPLFPKRASTITQPPPTPTSSNQMAKIMFGKPIYPSLRTPSSDSSLSDFDTDEDCISDSESDSKTEPEPLETQEFGIQVATPSRQHSRAPSPSAESVFYPLTTSTAPMHTYLDPLFYNESNVPPVPKIPAQYISSPSSSRGPSPTALSPPTSNSRRFRELPRPPTTTRSRSTPRPRTADASLSSPVESTVSAYSDRRPSYDSSFLVPSSPLRTLPRPPPTSPIDGPGPAFPPLRHSQSSGRSLNSRYSDKRSSQYSGRTLPPTPAQTRGPKRSYGHLGEWLSETDWPGPHPSTSTSRDSVFGSPPPAYNSIDFSYPSLISAVEQTSSFFPSPVDLQSPPFPPPPSSSPGTSA